MPAWMGGVIVFCVLIAFLIGLLSGWIMFHKTKDENYYAGWNDGFEKAYVMKNLDKAIADAKNYRIAILPNRIIDL